MYNIMNPPISNQITPTLHQPLHSKVSNYLNDQRRTGQFCDLIIELEAVDNDNADTDTDTDAEKVYGHFCVVAAQSRFIGESTNMQQKLVQFSLQNPLKVTIRNFSCGQCLQTILDFFYEDVVSIAKEHEQHFKQLAKMLAVTELMNLFEIQEEDPTIRIESNDGQHKDNNENGSIATGNDKQTDINVSQNNIFDDQRKYFKLKNPRATSSSTKVNYCIGCDFKCYRAQDMIKHMTSCEASHLTCSLCEVGFLGWREYDAHLRKHSNDMKKPFFCLECNSRFINRHALIVHLPKHSVEAPHQCPHCNKSFKWKQGLSNHLIIHNKEKKMLCDVCGYSTTHMKALKSHKLQHTGEFFKCGHPGCNHSTNRKENLKLHMETHKQERPFVCEICGCKFSQSKNLKRHALKHSAEEIKRYKCQLCTFCSHRSDKLKEHMQRVHTEKAVQLELSEIMENSFENKAEDEFNLPLIPTNRASSSKVDKTNAAPVKVRKKKKANVIQSRRIIPIRPKSDL